MCYGYATQSLPFESPMLTLDVEGSFAGESTTNPKPNGLSSSQAPATFHCSAGDPGAGSGEVEALIMS